MGNGLYLRSEDDSIVVKDKRKAWGVDIPAYVYDVWGQVITYKVIGVYGFLVRFQRNNRVKGLGYRELCKMMGGIDDKTLHKYLEMLHELRFITKRTPNEADRRKGQTIEIDILDPPDTVSGHIINFMKSKEWISKKFEYDFTLIHWLIDNEEPAVESDPRVLSDFAFSLSENPDSNADCRKNPAELSGYPDKNGGKSRFSIDPLIPNPLLVSSDDATPVDVIKTNDPHPAEPEMDAGMLAILQGYDDDGESEQSAPEEQHPLVKVLLRLVPKAKSFTQKQKDALNKTIQIADAHGNLLNSYLNVFVLYDSNESFKYWIDKKVEYINKQNTPMSRAKVVSMVTNIAGFEAWLYKKHKADPRNKPNANAQNPSAPVVANPSATEAWDASQYSYDDTPEWMKD